ncbi:hypothetical protein SAMN02910353_01120 [Ruminococcus sp. YRD2003]|uniref:hypothetical protein n=1 Tax=Ruminococcus sp. YRD2003 TaxID=1452313 RepID=UPI0008BE6D25|nr:hypothetical protein SAMN02910353_01120 [Ruminococcus flavefaciens]
MFDIEKSIVELSNIRPIFHSEADFQFALAWKIQETYPQAKIRLEKRIQGIGNDTSEYYKNRYIDILVEIDGKEIPIELKYKTRNNSKSSVWINNEEYNLKNQGAQDNGRYDYLKDISRIEEYVKDKSTNCECGYAIFLTNDHLYYESGDKSNSKQFRINEDIKYKKLDWENKSDSFKKYNANRNHIIHLNNRYIVKWNRYSDALKDIGDEFKYLILKITK